MTVLEQIIDWAKSLPSWQSDAVRLLLRQGQLLEEDIEDHLKILKASKGIPVEARGALPATDADASGSGGTNDHVVLKTMRDLENVNAVKPGQRIEFSPKGVTLIYGGNGTGKSGYSRVLKKACRARAAEPIMPDVFKQQKAGTKAKALFDFEIKGVSTPSTWEDGKSSSPHFGNFAVFDSKCERLYVDEENDVIYRPYGLDIFDKLGTLCKSMATKLTSELQQQPTTAEFIALVSDNTEAKNELLALNEDTPSAVIDKVCTFTQEQKQELDALTKQQAALIASDPARMAQEVNLQLQRFGSLLSTLNSLSEPLSSTSIENLKKLKSEMITAQTAVTTASAMAFTNEPLPGVGDEVWQKMFMAAKKYSEEIVYKDLTFPVTGKDKNCLLCQQPLSDQASDRLKRFWQFIEKDTNKAANEASSSFLTAVQKEAVLDSDSILKHAAEIEEVEGLKNGFKTKVDQFKADVAQTKSFTQEAAKHNTWDEVTPINSECITTLTSVIAALKGSLAELKTKTSNDDELVLIEKKLSELNARKTVCDNKENFKEHLKNMKFRKQINQCLAETDTRPISLKASKVAETAVTEALAQALKLELERFDLGDIYLEITKRVKGGITLHKLKFAQKTSENVSLSNVLSEGEQSVVGIASFLAELQTAPNVSGIIFDDPVSSLDHLRKSKIAERLVTEGKIRQVIIFTHDIEFFMDVVSESGIQRVPLGKQLLRRLGNEIGISENREPEKAHNVDARVNMLGQKIKQAEQTLQKGEEDAFHEVEKTFFESLRETWEQSIEDFVFQRVVKRFVPDIETQKLRFVVFDDSDYVKIYQGMTRASNFIHSAPRSKSTPKPDVSGMKECLKEFSDFIENLRIRQATAAKQRPTLVEPPKA